MKFTYPCSLFSLPLLACLAITSDIAAADVSLPRAQLFSKYCHDCHQGENSEGGLDLSAVQEDLSDPRWFAKWERIYDRIASGEMPPQEAAQPTEAERTAVLDELRDKLTAAHQRSKGTVLRRLNRSEYENTINDLLGTRLKLVNQLPADAKSHEFENVGEALGTSMVQVQRYLDCAMLAWDEVLASHMPPESKVTRASYADTRGGEQWLGKVWLKRDDGAVVFFRELGYPTGMLREANTRFTGNYKIRVTGYAFQSEKPITFALGATSFARGVEMPTFGYFSLAPGEPQTVEITARLDANYMIEITPQGLIDEGNFIRQNGIADYRGPGLAILHMELEGPLADEQIARGRALLLGDFEQQPIVQRGGNRGRTPPTNLIAENPSEAARKVLLRLGNEAFRRPVVAADVEPFAKLFDAQVAAGSNHQEALKTAVVALLCSPDFLFLEESSGQLNSHQLAARISYFLARTLPDAELRRAANSGELLRDPKVSRAQIDRLLASEAFDRCIADFTDAWLNLRDLEFTNPDAALYPEHDRYLQWSMREETRLFVRALFRENLPVRHLVKSDFAMLNERLAEHYEIEVVAGPDLRRVALPPGSLRGGVLTQASVLKVSANGTNTSPVVRGVYVMERILAQHAPPPPPGIPGVEPDIRGSTTLRELLAKHRDSDNCRACHAQIDPPGFALESFDPIGNYRERFRSIGDGERVSREVRGQKVRYKLGPPVDASGELASGEKFASYPEFRDQLAAREFDLAVALVTKLLTFATGREMGFSDRAEIRSIAMQTRDDGYRARDLLHAALASKIFRSK